MNPAVPEPGGRHANDPGRALSTPPLHHSSTPPLHHLTPAIPDHQLLRKIGGGSYGEVWLARNALGTYRAVKIVYRTNFDHDRPFEREFAGIQKFEPISRSHEGLVDLLQVGRNDVEGYFYYMMELADDSNAECGVPSAECEDKSRGSVESGARSAESALTRPSATLSHPTRRTVAPSQRVGEGRGEGIPRSALLTPDSYAPHTLKLDLQRRGRLPLDECIQLGLSLSNALAYLHGQGLVHRDIKPSNIIFVGGVPKLADVGLVAGVDDARSYVGTEGFIPPEGPGTAQADLYSLGIVLYQMSTGKSHQDFPEPLPDLAAQPDHARYLEFNAVIHKACRAEVRERYQAAEEMRAELLLLETGKSVKRRRAVQQFWAVGKKASLAVVLLVSVATVALTLIGLGSRVWQPRMKQDVEKRTRSGRESNLSVELGRLDEGKISTNGEANVLYARAMAIMRGDDDQKLGEACTNLVEATVLDPNFAKAYAALFEIYVRDVGLPRSQQDDKLRKFKAKLEELDPSLSMSATHLVRAFVQYMDWQFDEAKKSWEKAILLNWNNEFAHTSYGFALTRWGDSSNGLYQLSIAAELEPAKGQIQQVLGDPYYLRRDYTKALEYYLKASRFRPNSSWGQDRVGRAWQAMGQYLKAIDEFEKSALIDGADKAKTTKSFDQLRDAFRKNGEKGYWEERLRRTETKPKSEFYWKAVIHVHLGHTNEVFRWLNNSFETREGDGLHHELNNLLLDEYWDNLHGDPRFMELVRNMRFPGK
jgi:serine/threonine protein kinase